MQSKRKSATLFVQLEQDQYRYLCATPRRDRNHANCFSVLAFGESESGRSFTDITQELALKKIKAKNLVLLLPRSEFEVNLYQLPEVEEADLPSVISNLVSESMESLEFTTDFILNSREPDGQNAQTWTLENRTIQEYREKARQMGMSLKGITSPAAGSISLWRSLVRTKSHHAVIVTIANRSIDFSVIYNQEVTHIRSIPFPQTDIKQITARLISELQRTVAITGADEESDSTRIYLFGAPEHRKPIAEALTEEFEVPVSILNPIDHTEFADEQLTIEESESFAHLLGVAKAYFFDRLEFDLISPRKASKKTLPWKRIAIWAFIVLGLIGSAGFVIWDTAEKQQQEIVEKRKQFDSLATDARRVIEMKDELAAIRSWRKNEVVWLDQLDDLSRKLPPREQSLIRRVSMTAGESGDTRINLAVEVSDNSLVVGLEDSIRSENNRVTSKRVSESSDPKGERWNFETTIQFVAQPPKLSFISTEPKSDEPSEDESVKKVMKTDANLKPTRADPDESKTVDGPETVEQKGPDSRINKSSPQEAVQ